VTQWQQKWSCQTWCKEEGHGIQYNTWGKFQIGVTSLDCYCKCLLTKHRVALSLPLQLWRFVYYISFFSSGIEFLAVTSVDIFSLIPPILRTSKDFPNSRQHHRRNNRINQWVPDITCSPNLLFLYQIDWQQTVFFLRRKNRPIE
jgi:hypothetical protein